jgi:enoyl-CoA hydratase
MPAVNYQLDGPVARLTISRPQRRNALNHEALEELHAGVRRAREDAARCVVVTGSDNHFCAGADLKELEDLRFADTLRGALDDLSALPVPTIAAISGSCMGLGMQLALACDLRLATPEARFAVPVAKLGLMVDHWTIQRLAMLAGHSTARWMLLTAEPVHTRHAVDVGLVQRMVDPAEHGQDADPGTAVVTEADDLAGRISRLAPLSLAGSKLGLDLLERPGGDVDPRGAYRAAFERAWSSGDLVEGRRAFAEQRAPEFRGD